MPAEKYDNIAQALRKIANAITPLDACPDHDASGGYVSSLTEAVMGISAGLNKTADALESFDMTMAGVHDGLNNIADALRERPSASS